MRRENPDIWAQVLIAVLFIIGCFSFFQFVLPYHLFLKEQTLLFIFTADYFLAYLDKPAWLTRYIGDFLTQFYYLRGGGAVVISLVLLVQWYLLVKVFRKFKLENLAPWFALFPVVVEWILCCQLSYSIASPISLISILLLFLLYVKIRNRILLVVIGLVFIPVFYSLSGPAMFLFPVLVTIYEIQNSRKIWMFWLLLSVVALVYPSMVRSVYLLTNKQAYLYPSVSLDAFGPIILCVLIVLMLQVKKIRTLTLSIQSFSLIVGLLLLLFATGILKKVDFAREKVLGLASESYFGNWNRVYEMSEKNKESNRIISYYTNQALSMRNELPDRLLEFYQPASQGLFLPVNPQSGWLTIFFSSDVYFYLGDMNMAQHSAMLGQIFSPNHRSSRLTKRLAEINLVNGDTAACRKYLGLLSRTMFHRHWAARQEALLSDQDTATTSWLQQKRAQIPAQDTLRTSSDHYTSLQLLLQSNQDNRPAQDYLLCYLLLNKDISSFLTIFDTYWKGKEGPLPRVYAEALLIRLASEKASEKKVQSYGISREMISDFVAYTNLYEQHNGDIEPLRERFSSTYWFYYHFARMKE